MNSRLIIVNIFITLLLLTGVALFFLNKEKKVAYVTTMKVFEEFKMKKEIELKYQKIQIMKQTYLDSIRLEIRSLETTRKPEDELRWNELKKLYLIKEDQFNQENELLYKDFTEQIWKQLNQYVEDYGKENKYDFLFGAAGQGNIMYANDKEDKTKEVIEYVNKKYNGIKN